MVEAWILLLSGGEASFMELPLGLPCSPPELDPDEFIRLRFSTPRIRGCIGSAGDGEGGEGGELRTSSSAPARTSGDSLGVLDLTVVVFVEVLDPADRVDLVDFCFVTDPSVDFGFEPDVGVVACARVLGFDFNEFIRLAGEGSELEPHSSSEGASRFGSFCFTGLALLPFPRFKPCEPPTSGGLSLSDLTLGLPIFGGVAVSGNVKEVDSGATTAQVRGVGRRLVSISTYGICLLEVEAEPFFPATFDSEAGDSESSTALTAG